MTDLFMTSDQRVRCNNALKHLREAEREYRSDRHGNVLRGIVQAQRELEEIRDNNS